MHLDDELIIETPERVELRYAVASIGNRFLAAFIDHLIQLVAIVAFGLITGIMSSWAVFSSSSVWGAAMLVLAVFGVYWGYFVFFETLWSGQTPGKRIMKLRVVREDGRPVRFFEVFVRNLLRLVVDFQPLPSYAVGVVSIVFSPNSKRIGDFVAGTVVVKERATEAPSLEEIVAFAEVESADLERVAPAFKIDWKLLTDAELNAVGAFLKRRYELPSEKRRMLAVMIAGPLALRLGVENKALSPEQIIEEIDRQHRTKPYRYV